MGSSYTSRGGYVDDYDKRYETSRADHRELDVEREKPSSRRYEDSYSSQRSKSRRYTRSKSPGGQRNSRSPDTDDDNRRRSRSRGESRGHRRRTRSRSRSRGHSRSRDYERGGSRSCRRTRSRSREDSRGRWTKRRRTRSKSPAASGSSVKNELKTEADNYYNDYDDDWVEEDVDLGYGVTSRDLVGLSREEKIAVRDKYCDLCQVTLGDPASMVGHVRGMKHIQAKKDRGLPVPGLVDTTDEPVDTKFWIKQENKKRVEEASKNTAYDVSKVNQQKAKFNKRSCDNGQFRNMYCDICGVTVHSRDTYENHIQGAEHKRRAEKPITYKCDLCHVYVPCQNSLNSHFQGKDHIKRLNERSVRKGLGYDDNAQAPNSLSRDEEKEYRELKTQVNNLQRQVKDLNAKNIECRKKHKTTKELQDKKNELDREIAYYKRRCKELDDQMEQMSNAIPKREIKDEKIKTELKPKKEEYIEKENDNFEVIDVE